MRNIEDNATIAVECGLRIHRELGPGLLESLYEAVMAPVLTRKGFKRIVNNHDPFAPSRLRVSRFPPIRPRGSAT